MRATLVDGIAVALMMSGCASNNDSQGNPAVASAHEEPNLEGATGGQGTVDLPINRLHVGEIGPTSVGEAFRESDVVVVAELASVTDAVRIYDSGSDDPRPTYWEDIGLVFSPVSTVKGPAPRGAVSIPWTAYERAGGGPSGERIAAIETAGLLLNEEDIGKQYLLLLRRDASSDLDVVALSAGIVEVAADGIIVEASDVGVMRDLEGRQLADVVLEHLGKDIAEP